VTRDPVRRKSRSQWNASSSSPTWARTTCRRYCSSSVSHCRYPRVHCSGHSAQLTPSQAVLACCWACWQGPSCSPHTRTYRARLGLSSMDAFPHAETESTDASSHAALCYTDKHIVSQTSERVSNPSSRAITCGVTYAERKSFTFLNVYKRLEETPDA